MEKTILVVDDDPAVLLSYSRLLHRLGYRVLTSQDSEKVGSDPDSLRDIDLVILDQRMPRTTGLALLAGLRRRADFVNGGGEAGDWPHRPAVILISAFLSDDLKREAIRLGVVEVIEKPVDATRFLASVRAALESPSRVARHARRAFGSS